MLSFLSKETGLLFVPIEILWLMLFDRGRLWKVVGVLAIPAVAYLALRIPAVGFQNPENAPIDDASLGIRLLNVPSEIAFYVGRFMYPVGLASSYHWVHTEATLRAFWFPLAIDVLVIALLTFAGIAIRRRGSRDHLKTYAWFSAWLVIGVGSHLQLIPLDMTASETWAYLPVAGLLGMLGVVLGILGPLIRPRVSPAAGLAVLTTALLLLGARTALRGLDWHDPNTLAGIDIVNSPEDFNAATQLAYEAYDKGDPIGAQNYARKAEAIYPGLSTENTLGQILLATGDYTGAYNAFIAALAHQKIYYVYENLGLASIYLDNGANDTALLLEGVKEFPSDGQIWFHLAIQYQRMGQNANAKIAIGHATSLGAGTPYYVKAIANNETLTLPTSPPELAPNHQ
jgi:hypothetical protein